MSKVAAALRSFDSIRTEDLRRLLEIAVADRISFFERHPDWRRLYADRVLAVALCQGAALHFCLGERGINDFDVYTFYAEHPRRRWYAKRRAIADFGNNRFGRSSTHPHFVGRRVDLLARSIPASMKTRPAGAIQDYLRAGRTPTARLLAQAAVVLLDPDLSRCIWLRNDAA
jgi:hypothetical protein